MKRLGSMPLTSHHHGRDGLNPRAPKYLSSGTDLLGTLIRSADLRPDSKILDIGCGTGRLGHALLDYLTTGQYHGIDVNRRFIEHCRHTFRFRKGYSFRHLDQQHPEWNPRGKNDHFQGQGSYDLVIMIDVLQTQDFPRVARLINSAGQALRHYGYLVCTACLLNHHSMAHLLADRYSHRTPDSWHGDTERPLLGVAHPEEGFRRALIRSRLQIREPIRYGSWYDNDRYDVVVALKI